MSYEKSVSEHYSHGALLDAIEKNLPALGKTIDNVTVEDLAPVDEFHIGGRAATDHLLDQVAFPAQGHLLDVGCGLGGAARHVAQTSGRHVSGIDLTTEYIETGNALCAWLNLQDSVTLVQGSALSLPFNDHSFDGAYMLHVGMNIADKALLFTEIYRALKPGAFFAVYDIMQQTDGELAYPVPWASESSTSQLASAGQYAAALKSAGFEITQQNNRRDFALEFFKQLKARTEANGGPAPLGLHVLMRQSTAEKIQNMVANIKRGLIAPEEIIARKP